MNTQAEDVRELFELVYGWGKENVAIDEHATEFREKLLKIAREVALYEQAN